MSIQSPSPMNGFDYLRLAAAILVVAHHAGILAGSPPTLLGAGPDPGALGVGIFFVISGYLVTKSAQATPGARIFMAKRLLRIFPGLCVALVLTAFVLGPMVTNLGAQAYFSGPAPFLYVLRNLSLYGVTYELPGVFTRTPYPEVVNGSLWSLRLEFTCYLGLALLHLLRSLRAPILIGLGLAAGAGFLALHLTGLDGRGGLMRIAALAALNGWFFLAGAACRTLAIRPPLWTGLVGLVLLATPAWLFATPLAVIALGARAAPKLPADISYGLYIYSFPLQQVLAQAGHLGLLSSLALTLPFAAVSWFFVEKPALALKARLAPQPEGLAG